MSLLDADTGPGAGADFGRGLGPEAGFEADLDPGPGLPGEGRAAPGLVARRTGRGWRRARGWGPRLRLATGLLLFAFAATHFLNHALGLVSLNAMDAVQDVRTAVTRSTLGRAILLGSALVHLGLGIAAFLRVRSPRVGARRAVQLAFGLMIPVLLIRHVIGTAGVNALFGVDTDYSYALWAMWPSEAVNQAALMVLVWVHGCIGLHLWLVRRAAYRRTLPVWYAAAVLVPALAYAGFVAAGRLQAAQGGIPDPLAPGEHGAVAALMREGNLAYAAILGAALAAWAALLVRDRTRARFTVRYAGGPAITARRGQTLLEISRAHRVPHASVCGGRARCSTCRVRVTQGVEDLPEPSASEARVLRRIGAPGNVRLACQLRPTADLGVSALLPAGLDAASGAQTDKYLWGVEQEVTVLFCDLRGFTALSANRLSYDVVFFLNQFLGRMAGVIEDGGGFVDKFMGDGIMAIFGMGTTVEDGARRAIRAARAMGADLDALNASLADELRAPLAMGIGIHTGPAILGRVGARRRGDRVAALTALGETVNVASRLEGRSKDLGVEAVVSLATLTAAGLEGGHDADGPAESGPGGTRRGEDGPAPGGRCALDLRGLDRPIEVIAARRAADLPQA